MSNEVAYSAYLFRLWRIGDIYYSEDWESIYFSYQVRVILYQGSNCDCIFFLENQNATESSCYVEEKGIPDN